MREMTFMQACRDFFGLLPGQTPLQFGAEIKNRSGDAVLYACEVPEDVLPEFHLRYAVEAAVRARAAPRFARLPR